MPEFQDRLSYIDKRYDHLRRLTHTLRKKVNELEDIMRLDNDEENMETIQKLLEEIRVEKQKMRDESKIIRGELSQAMYNEDLRKHMTGEHRRAEEEKQKKEEGASQGEEVVYTPTSSEGLPYKETNF